ncbi:ParB/RepB/Spo0J family partition protein [Streptomyces tsukubensis]|uniref:ParB/RepB/Spo0J family partition protein n=1 Tax=Streptomyces tsukubensis TaxID=83656 RepID=UPI00344E6B4A
MSFADLANDDVEDEPGVAAPPPARWIATELCLPNPRNPRDDVGDLSSLASIKERQLQSCLAITPDAYLRLWPEDRDALNAGPDHVVIINGNRRRAAAELYGRPELLVVVDDDIASSRAAVLRAAYDENTARQDFDPVEEAKAVAEIVSQYGTAKEAAEAQGWSQTWISHRKNLLKLHPDLQREVRSKARGEEGMSINVARRLGSVKGIHAMGLPEQRQALAELLAADSKANEVRKEARRKVRSERTPPAATPEVKTEERGTPGAGEFSAENSETSEPVSKGIPAPAAPAEVPGARKEESGTPPGQAEFSAENREAPAPDKREQEAPASPTPSTWDGWVIPEMPVRRLSALLVRVAGLKGTTPEEELVHAESLLREHYASAGE